MDPSPLPVKSGGAVASSSAAEKTMPNASGKPSSKGKVDTTAITTVGAANNGTTSTLTPPPGTLNAATGKKVSAGVATASGAGGVSTGGAATTSTKSNDTNSTAKDSNMTIPSIGSEILLSAAPSAASPLEDGRFATTTSATVKAEAEEGHNNMATSKHQDTSTATTATAVIVPKADPSAAAASSSSNKEQPPPAAKKPVKVDEHGNEVEDERVISEEDREKISDEDADDVAYTAYQPSKLPYGRPHPDPVVENSSLGAVQPPDVTCTYFSTQKYEFYVCVVVLLLSYYEMCAYVSLVPTSGMKACNACMHISFYLYATMWQLLETMMEFICAKLLHFACFASVSHTNSTTHGVCNHIICNPLPTALHRQPLHAR